MLYFISFCKESEIFYKIHVLKNFYIYILYVYVYIHIHINIYTKMPFFLNIMIYIRYISENKSKTLPPSI